MLIQDWDMLSSQTRLPASDTFALKTRILLRPVLFFISSSLLLLCSCAATLSGATASTAFPANGKPRTPPSSAHAGKTPAHRQIAVSDATILSQDVFSTQTPSDFPLIIADDLDRESLERVILNQLTVMENANLSERIRLGGLMRTKGELKQTLETFLNLMRQTPDDRDFHQKVRETFAFYKVGSGEQKKVLFTGYYTPVIEASRVRTGEYIHPLYRVPDDAGEVSLTGQVTDIDNDLSAPSWRNLTRKQIDHYGVLRHRNLEIAWLKDDLERFFLHIQGSGMLLFPDGRTQGLRYAAANNYNYAGIGKLMMKDGVLGPGERSMQGIKKYLREHPEEMPKYLYQNKRYIFFAYTDGGPRGSGGAELVGGRSIATDKSIYSAGGLALIFIRKPVLNASHEIEEWKRVARFVIDQDTGSDITGPGRADLYYGTGHQAGVMAGNFKEWGEIYYLVKKN